MAVRIALFHALPKPKAEQKSGAKSGGEVTAKSRAKGAAKGKPRAKRDAKPGTKPKPKPRAKPKAEAKPRAKPKARARRPPPPVLQRRTLGPTVARAAVLAVAIVCMVGFAVALAKVTLVPSPASDALIHTNLRPGASIRTYLDQPAIRDTLKQIGGNILLGVPFGVLLPTLFPRARGLVRVAVVTALAMVLVEVVQGAIVEGRAFDIDDVILNTLGALFGYLLLGRRLGHALHPRRETWWRRARAAVLGVRPGRPPARKRP